MGETEGWDSNAESRPLPPWPRIPHQHPRVHLSGPDQMRGKGSPWLCQEAAEPEQAGWLAVPPAGKPAGATLGPTCSLGFSECLLFSGAADTSLLRMAFSSPPQQQPESRHVASPSWACQLCFLGLLAWDSLPRNCQGSRLPVSTGAPAPRALGSGQRSTWSTAFRRDP